MLQKEKLKSIYKNITYLKDYTPSKKVNSIFKKLVNEALKQPDMKALSRIELDNLQKICSLSEYKLEEYWAEIIINNKEPEKVLKKFPYFENYKKLTRMEFYSLVSCLKHKKHKVLFIGGGPLPLTAIILAKEYGKRVTILEKDKNAFDISRNLIKKLNLSEKIRVINQNAIYFDKYSDFNVILVAALAGVTKHTKNIILKKIKQYCRKETHILARSSWGGRELLYKPVDPSIFKMFKPQIEVRPYNDIVNSVFIFKT